VNVQHAVVRDQRNPVRLKGEAGLLDAPVVRGGRGVRIVQDLGNVPPKVFALPAAHVDIGGQRPRDAEDFWPSPLADFRAPVAHQSANSIQHGDARRDHDPHGSSLDHAEAYSRELFSRAFLSAEKCKLCPFYKAYSTGSGIWRAAEFHRQLHGFISVLPLPPYAAGSAGGTP
jgi:hypothetical protein